MKTTDVPFMRVACVVDGCDEVRAVDSVWCEAHEQSGQKRPRAIHGRSKVLWQWLVDAGICHDGDRVTRVVIDMGVNDVVQVYVQKLGDERVLSVSPPAVVWTEPEGQDA